MTTLNLLERRKARRLARVAWVESNGDAELAETIFRSSPEAVKIDPNTILLFLQIAMVLWKFWKENKITHPTHTPRMNEPVDWVGTNA